jgi:hypothetical protein
MTKLYDILEDLKNGPTILTLLQIVNISDLVQSVSIDELAKNRSALFEILDILVDSYSDAAIFEINTHNHHILDKFINWLLSLSEDNLFSANRPDIRAYSKTLSQNFIGVPPV